MKRITAISLRGYEPNVKLALMVVNDWLVARGQEPVTTYYPDDYFNFHSIELDIPVKGCTEADFDPLVNALRALSYAKGRSLSITQTVEEIEPGLRYFTPDGSPMPLGLPDFADPVNIAARACIRSGYAALAAGFAAL